MFVLDAVMALLAWPLVLAWMLATPGIDQHLARDWIAPALLYPAEMLLCFYALGLYRRDVVLETRKALGRLPMVLGLGGLTAMIAGKLLTRMIDGWQEPAHATLLFTAAVGCFGISAVAARLLFRSLRRYRLMRLNLLVIGAGARAWDLVWMLRKEGRYLAYEITCLHDPSYGPIDPRLRDDPTVTLVTATSSLLDEARRLNASDIVVAPDERRGMDLEALLACKTAGFMVEQYLSFVEREIRRVDLKRMELSWIVYSEGFQVSLLDRALKRTLDICVSLVMLTIASPVLLLAMVAIVIDDGWPVLYRQTRITQDRRHFSILKLRTMRRDAEAGGAVWAASGDDRITRVGHFLRRSRLDELPQLFNVLRGDMSLVGPRPERPEFVHELTEKIPLYNQRHMVKAGLTGWAQVNYPYGASIDDARSKLSYDLYYVKNYVMWFDVIILLQTARVVLWPSGVR
ncbi:MAG: TIGR03013 family PEP-CTERM/XrtA system glycosyltransferase [Acetobacteraceae bacterium]|nr:TIGR03013 family PEP-CTERM/XrtA system glycosyltransferase [Acetobacteraceae bacterium]